MSDSPTERALAACESLPSELFAHPGSSRYLNVKIRAAFTLVELLTVIGLMVVLMAILAPAISGIKGGSDFTSAVNAISGILENSRAYAIANNTYALVGFAEYDVSVSPDEKQNPGFGRLVIGAVARKDGLRGFDIFSTTSTWNQSYNNGRDLAAIGDVQVFENMHLAANLGFPTWSDDMTNRLGGGGQSDLKWKVGHPSYPSGVNTTPFSWPLGSAVAAGKYNFRKIITFDPNGLPHGHWPPSEEIFEAFWVELQMCRTNTEPPVPTDVTKGNHAWVHVNGITGSIRVFRP